MRQELGGDGGGAALVIGVGVGVQEADRHRLDPFPGQLHAGLADRPLVQLLQHLAARVQALPHLEPQAPLDQGLRQLEEQVVDVVASLAADLQGVPEAGGRQQAGARSLALDQGVGDQGGSVNQPLDLRRVDPGGIQRLRRPPPAPPREGSG